MAYRHRRRRYARRLEIGRIAGRKFMAKRPSGEESPCAKEWAHQDSNLGPPGYEPGALPIEL